MTYLFSPKHRACKVHIRALNYKEIRDFVPRGVFLQSRGGVLKGKYLFISVGMTTRHGYKLFIYLDSFFNMLIMKG